MVSVKGPVVSWSCLVGRYNPLASFKRRLNVACDSFKDLVVVYRTDDTSLSQIFGKHIERELKNYKVKYEFINYKNAYF